MHIVAPEFTPVAVALALMIACNAFTAAVTVILRQLPNAARPLLFPVAFAIAAVPLTLRSQVVSFFGGEADAQLGMFIASSAFAWTVFRMIELSVGTSPDGAFSSTSEAILYMTSGIDPRYANGKPLVPPPGKVGTEAKKVLGIYLLTAAWISAIEPFGYRPATAAAHALGLDRLGERAVSAFVVVGNNLLGTMVVFLILWLLFSIGGIVVLLQGHDVIESMRNPLFTSRSPREFWGKRWNLQVNAMLKRACYKPLASIGVPSALAAIATFGASALFHEYQFMLCMPGYVFGTAGRFFLGQALLVVSQNLLEPLPLVGALMKSFGWVPTLAMAMVTVSIMSIVPDTFICNWIDLPTPMFATIARIVPRVIW